MKYSDFEKHIGTELRNAELEIDTNALLNQLKKKNRKKRLPFFFIIGFTALSMLFGLYFAISHFENTDTQIINNTTPLPNSKLGAGNSETQKLNPTSLQYTKGRQLENSSTISFEDSKTQSIENSTTISFEDSKTQSIENSSTIPLNPASLQYARGRQLRNSTPLPYTTLGAGNSENSSTESLENSSTESLNPASLQYTRAGNSITKLLPINFNEKITPVSEPTVNINSKIDCPDFKDRKPWFSPEIVVEAGYFRPLKTFELAAGDTSFTNILRVKNETSREGLHAAIYGRFNATSLPVYIQTGLGYNRLTERMEVAYEETKRDTTQGIISITKSEGGDTVTIIMGDIITETLISGYKKKHYSIQTLDIPVIIGYQIPLGRFSLGIEGGALFNISTQSSGNILTSASNFEELGNVNTFRNRIDLSYLAGLQLAYEFYPRHTLYLNSRMRIIPGNFTNAGTTLGQKYNFMGVNLAYGYRF